MPLFAALACAITATILLITDAKARWFARVQNFQGREVSIAGLALLAGTFAGLSLRVIDGAPDAPAALLTVTGFGLLGALDDRYGNRSASGFRGHLRAAVRGQLTTGFWKIVGGGAVALVGAWLAAPPAGTGGWPLLIARAMLIALAANAWNLLDTRPARAASVFLVLALPLALFLHAHTLWVAIAGAAVFLPWDRRRTVMLGDAGSNLLGAAWGIAFAAAAGPAALAAGLIALAALNAWSERHSLNAEIAARPWLARLDAILRGPDPAPTRTRETQP